MNIIINMNLLWRSSLRTGQFVLEKLPRGLGSRVEQLNCRFSMKTIGLFQSVNCLVRVS